MITQNKKFIKILFFIIIFIIISICHFMVLEKLECPSNIENEKNISLQDYYFNLNQELNHYNYIELYQMQINQYNTLISLSSNQTLIDSYQSSIDELNVKIDESTESEYYFSIKARHYYNETTNKTNWLQETSKDFQNLKTNSIIIQTFIPVYVIFLSFLATDNEKLNSWIMKIFSIFVFLFIIFIMFVVISMVMIPAPP